MNKSNKAQNHPEQNQEMPINLLYGPQRVSSLNHLHVHTKFIIMCHHKRIVYCCWHFGWGTQVKACVLEKAFLDGFCLLPCDTMWSHPLHSIKVDTVCKDCDFKRQKARGAMTKLKVAMQELNETVSRLQNL